MVRPNTELDIHSYNPLTNKIESYNEHIRMKLEAEKTGGVDKKKDMLLDKVIEKMIVIEVKEHNLEFEQEVTEPDENVHNQVKEEIDNVKKKVNENEASHSKLRAGAKKRNIMKVLAKSLTGQV